MWCKRLRIDYTKAGYIWVKWLTFCTITLFCSLFFSPGFSRLLFETWANGITFLFFPCHKSNHCKLTKGEKLWSFLFHSSGSSLANITETAPLGLPRFGQQSCFCFQLLLMHDSGGAQNCGMHAHGIIFLILFFPFSMKESWENNLLE